MKDRLPHIVIVGGGAGGIELAVQLGNTLGKKHLAEISLVDKNLTHLWKPLLHEVAAGTINSYEDEVDYLELAKQHYFNFDFGILTSINRKAKKIIVQANGITEKKENSLMRDLSYDILVLAVGSVTNDFNTEGVKEYCYFLDNKQQAENLHQEFLNYFIKAQYQEETKLQIAIIGGGATGIELAAELHYAAEKFKQYDVARQGKKQMVEMTIIEAGSRLLTALTPELSSQIKDELNANRIKILLNEKVSKATKEGIYTQTGQYIPSQLKIWAAGIKCDEYMKQLDGLEVNKLNQLLVKKTLQTTLDESIFAMGDCASCPQPDNAKLVPPRAQSAHQEAKLLAKSLKRLINGKSLLSFKYKDFGSLVTISKHTAIGQLMAHKGINIGFGGRIARWMYVALYKRHQLSILGWWKTMLLTVASFFIRPAKLRLKLH